MKIPAYHKQLDTLHVNCVPARSYFIPFDSVSACEGTRETSPFYKTLCGSWSFRFCESFEQLGSSFASGDLDASGFDEITVPQCWQTLTDRGYDVPLYSNERYAFPTDPPHVPDENPCGIYTRSFFVEQDFLRSRLFLNFEGVAPCFYVFINGNFVGYSQVSHCTSEFDVTDYVTAGDNTISVLVVKWCDGCYLEDQDFFRMSGIFREVYLLSRAETYLRDVYVKTYVDASLNSATVEIEADIAGDDEAVYTLLTPNGETAARFCARGKAEIRVDSPELWSDERPLLYKLYIELVGETVLVNVGLKRLEIKDGVVLLNSKPVKLRGINRHDSHPVLGYTTPVPHMQRDLHMLKCANVNCIRTSHYPNDPRFMEMCNALGFFVVDEADIETHGMGRDYGEWDWPRWSSLSDSPQWEAAYVDRAQRLFERDKNCVCVVMWSLGNESGVGNNHRAMRRYIKSRDERAIVHYENSHKEFPCVPEGEDYSDISDVESRMYADIDYQRKYLTDSANKKPFYLCEYVDSVTTGDVYANWDNVEEFDGFFGACIWEWCDHAVIVEENGKKKYCYGGDFGDYPHDGICCIDGVVYPDRRPRPGYFDMKKVYKPYKIYYENGCITVESKRYFTALSDCYIVWSVESDGKLILQGETPPLDIAPHEKKVTSLFVESSLGLRGECILNISVRQRFKTPWADAGYETGFEQFKLEAASRTAAVRQKHTLRVETSDRFVTVNVGETEYVFDRSYCRLCEIKNNARSLLSEPVQFNFMRAPEYNSFGSLPSWKKAELDRIKQKTYFCNVTQNDNSVTVEGDVSLGGPGIPPLIRGHVKYTVHSEGYVTVSLEGKVRENAPDLPRIGIMLKTCEGLEQMEYYGMGDRESYPDKHNAAKIGHFKTTVSDNFEHYLRPQENGSHYGTLWGSVGDERGHGLVFRMGNSREFSFNALHFTPDMLLETGHDCDLIPLNETVVYLDWRMNSASQSSQIAALHPERILNCKSFEFSFAIEPAFLHGLNPFSLL